MLYLGIDPGQKGGIVLIDDNRKILEKIPMPPDAKSLHSHLKKIKSLYKSEKLVIIVEKAQPISLQGVISVFTYGKHFGEICGVLDSLRMPFSQVSPRTWTLKLHVNYQHLASPKEKSLHASTDLFGIREFIPKEFIPGSRALKPHDGMIDAALLAWYGKLMSDSNLES